MIDTLLGRQVIVVSNNVPPYTGFVKNYCPVTGQPVVVDGFSDKTSIAFGVVLPFTETTWAIVTNMTVEAAWEWAGNISLAIRLRERKG